jgi:hypothetical protein
MKKIIGALLLLMCLVALCQGCNRRAWYEGLRDMQRQECYKYSDSFEVQDCLDRVNSMTYDEYEKNRSAKKK